MKKTLTLLIPLLLAAGALRAAEHSLTPGSYILEKNNTYKLSAADNTTSDYTLTSGGKEITSNLQINTNTSGTVNLTLQNFHISHTYPIVIVGNGTVNFISKVSTNTIIKNDLESGKVINALNTGCTLRFQGETDLHVYALNTETSTTFNVVPIRATTVSLESGTLVCHARCSKHYADAYPLAPVIDATTVMISGDTTVLQTGFASGWTKISDSTTTGTYTPVELITLQHSPIKCTTLTCTGGTIRHATGTRAFPSTASDTFTTTEGVRYAYPDTSFDSLISQAQGGTILNKRIFHFPGWTPVDGTDYSACFAKAEAAALTVNTDARTIAVDLSISPNAEPVYTADSCADAATLFGADTVPTSEGLKVAYAFGIDRLTSDGSAVFARVAVDLPQATEDKATFYLEIFEAGNAKPVYSGKTVFTREAADSIRFVTNPISVLTGLARSASLTRAYTVTAEAATE